MYSKTKFFIISFCLLSFNSICQNTFVPDDNFEQALIDFGFDTPPLNDNVPTLNISSITDLDITNRNISDLTGIEDFISLTNLDCSNNQLSTLNVSQNINLTELYCSENRLNNLDVTNLPNLIRLWCFSNQLSNLNVRQNPGLISLRCENNLLTNLDASNNVNLNVLACEQNQITTINVSNNANLSRFQCANNALTDLDISSITNLSYLSCEQNFISELNLSNNKRLTVLLCFNNQLSSLNLTENSDLIHLECNTNNLCILNLKNGNNNNVILMNFDSNPSLNCVVVDNSNANHSLWEPSQFSNYVNSINDCSDLIPVDVLENVIATAYTLPVLNYGNYYTEPGGMGLALNAGDIITTSQTIYIYNETNCNSNESSFVVAINNTDYFIPKFFTPNNDGANDVWQIYDRLNLVNNISIYNRHGKLLKFLPNTASGWDGTFNGELMRSDSYWYKIILNSNEILHGYFALKR